MAPYTVCSRGASRMPSTVPRRSSWPNRRCLITATTSRVYAQQRHLRMHDDVCECIDLLALGVDRVLMQVNAQWG
jgi:hypothetical protein